MRDPCAHVDRRVTCGACVQRYCATCQGPACPHPAQEIEPAPPLDEEEIARLRQEHYEMVMLVDTNTRKRGDPLGVCHACDQSDAADITYPCAVIRALDTLDQERALRQAAETALVACEARLAEAEQWRDFYQSALRRGRTAFDAGDMKEARTAFSCGLVSAPNEQDLAWAKAWLATEEGQQVLAEVQQAHPAPPPVEETG